MLNRIFFYLLWKFSGNEEQRIKIYKVLNKQVEDNYPEQTMFGNVYNSYIEFVMANSFIQKKVMEEDRQSIDMLKNGLSNSYDRGVEFLKSEKPWERKSK